MSSFEAKAKAIPKGRTVEDNAQTRAVILNLIVSQLRQGSIGRGSRVRDYSAMVGLNDDRPRKLVAHIKGGGGDGDQLQRLLMQLCEVS